MNGGVSRRAVVAGMAVLLSGAACTGGSPGPRRIRVAAGSPAGVDDIGRQLAELIDRRLADTAATVVPTAASAEIIAMVARGEADVGFSPSDILTPEARVTALARVYDDLLHLVVAADSPITTVEDLRGRRVSVGAPGSGTAVTAGRLLAAAGLTAGGYDRSELGLEDSMATLSQGTLDAFFFSGGLPVAGLRRLSGALRIRVVDLAGWAGALRGYSDVYVARNVPTSAYQTTPSATVGQPSLLVASPALAEDLAYDVTRLLLEHRDALAVAHPAIEGLDVRSAIATMPAPLHPGAARYYRTIKP